MKQSEKWLIKYVRPPLGFAGISVLGLVFGAVMSFLDNERKWFWLIGGAVIFLYLFLDDYLLPIIRLRMKLSRIKKQGKYELLLDDYRSGERVFGKALILGSTYVMAEDCGNIYRCDEISAVCLVQQDSGAYEGHYMLFINDSKGKRRRLCIVYRQNYQRQDLDKVYSYLAWKNPNVRIGAV